MSRLVATLFGCALLLAASATAATTPFWGAKQSSPVELDPNSLRPGEFIWAGDVIPAGPIVVVVSLRTQLAFVYRNGIRIGVTKVSAGKAGHSTPTGVFKVLQKDATHRSSIYNDAPMPYTQRLTWGGVALHAGGVPGYPTSHGCIHLPSEFARRLFEVSPMGMVVVVSDEESESPGVQSLSRLAPIDAETGREVERPALAPGEEERWQPEASPSGPVTIVVSASDRGVIVFRNAIEIGRAKFELRDPGQPLGLHAYVLLENGRPAGEYVPTGALGAPRWMAVSLPGHDVPKGQMLDLTVAERVVLSRDFVLKVRSVIAPGDALVVTDVPLLDRKLPEPVQILDDQPPAAGGS